MNHKLPAVLAAFFFLASGLAAQTQPVSVGADPATPAFEAEVSTPFKIKGYGAFSYSQREVFVRDFTRDYRKEMDLERFVLIFEAKPTDKLEIEAEIEFEHGGTGAEMELDEVEEFGEFETEVSKGGEVIVEELYAKYSFTRWFRLRGGHFYVPIGFLPFGFRPGQYQTVMRGEAETRLLPSLWHETGFDVSGYFGPFYYQAGVVNGLDSTGFSSTGWVKEGHQKRFEKVRAEELAGFARIDVDLAKIAPLDRWIRRGLIGGFYYRGGSAQNRPKNDLTKRMALGINEYGKSTEPGSADVEIKSLHTEWITGPITFRYFYVYGTLENADQVTYLNKRLSNLLQAPRTPVASAAEGWFYELSLNILHWFSDTQQLDLYARYDYTDSMAHIEKVVDMSQKLYGMEYTTDNPRYRWKTRSIGLHYRPNAYLSLKGQYSRRRIGTTADGITRSWGPEYDPIEEEYHFGVGFQF